MGKKIRNMEKILSHGDVDSKKIVLEIAERTLQHLDARERIRGIARREGSMLYIGAKCWDLSKK